MADTIRKTLKVLGVAHGDLITELRVDSEGYLIRGDLIVHDSFIYQVVGIEPTDKRAIIMKADIKVGDTIKHLSNNFYSMTKYPLEQ